jgi:crossover junction endodeoxyribonuclease RuvC
VRILGLDPGSRHTGYGVVEAQGDRLRTIAHGRISCRTSEPIEQRLRFLHEELGALLAEWHPDAVALESLFHGINSRSLIVLAQARGALLARIAAAGMPVVEYSPAEVKSAVTGNGRADKTQVQRMVSMLLSVPLDDLSPDSADALALAICYSHRRGMERLAERLEEGR